MGDKLIMSKKERQRKVILEQLKEGHITRKDAQKRLKVSKRHLIRLIQRYEQSGDEGLVHRSRGKPSGRCHAADFKRQVLARYEERYKGFGPTFAAEKLEEDDQLKVHPETLRLWLKLNGIGYPRRKGRCHRTRRERRGRFGEMLQLDGSIHPWFEGVDEKQCLMNMVDDATGKTLSLMDTGETTHAAFALLRWWITEAGIPMSIYVDLKSLYIAPKSLRLDSDGELVEPDWLTHFSKACRLLGIEVVKAYSPQAKGRVERSHGVYQDRLVKELKLKGITEIEQANQFLSQTFINKLNTKFAKPAREEADAHVPLTADNDLDQILCWDEFRVLKNDWTIRYNNCHYQVEKAKTVTVRPKQKVLVRRHLDQRITLWYKDQLLPSRQVEKTAVKAEPRKKNGHDSHQRSKISRSNKHKTPWGNFNSDWLKKKAATYPQGPQSA